MIDWDSLPPDIFDSYPEQLDVYAVADEAGAATLLVGAECGLCLHTISAREIVWWDAESELPTHPECWMAELAEASDPYRFYGVRRSDF